MEQEAIKSQDVRLIERRVRQEKEELVKLRRRADDLVRKAYFRYAGTLSRQFTNWGCTVGYNPFPEHRNATISALCLIAHMGRQKTWRDLTSYAVCTVCFGVRSCCIASSIVAAAISLLEPFVCAIRLSHYIIK